MSPCTSVCSGLTCENGNKEEEESTWVTELENTAWGLWGLPVSWLSPTSQTDVHITWAHSRPIPPGNVLAPGDLTSYFLWKDIPRSVAENGMACLAGKPAR